MKPVNIHEAKTHLSRLVERVQAGEEIVIAKAGVPAARLVPIAARHKPIEPGRLRNLKVPEGFNRLFEAEIEAMFGSSPPRTTPRKRR